MDILIDMLITLFKAIRFIAKQIISAFSSFASPLNGHTQVLTFCGLFIHHSWAWFFLAGFAYHSTKILMDYGLLLDFGHFRNIN